MKKSKKCARIRPFRLQAAALALGWGLIASPSSALQSLSVFVEGATQTHPQMAEAIAQRDQREAEEEASTWRLLPTFSASASYARNQYEREILFPGSTEPEAFIAQNQLDAALVLSVPLIHVAAWEGKAAAKASSKHAKASAEAVALEIERQVVRAYYQLVGSSALEEAAKRSNDLAKANLALVNDRRQEGAATDLDVKRAEAEVARTEQDIAGAHLARLNSARTLSSLSGVQPGPVTDFPADDLRREKPLEEWTRDAQSAPAIVAAEAAKTATTKQADAARAAWYPAVTGIAQERFSNATALVGHPAYYSFQIGLTWKFDGANLHAPKANNAAARAAAAREEERRRFVEDGVFQAYHQVETGIVRASAAERQATAAKQAAAIAAQQYAEGMTTQLEVLAAQQSAFVAEVAHIQATADLAYARAALRVLSAKHVGVEGRSK